MTAIHNRLEEAAHEAIRALFVDNSVNSATTRLTLLELQTIIALRLDAIERMQEVRCLLSEEKAAERQGGSCHEGAGGVPDERENVKEKP